MRRSNILLAFLASGALVAGPAFARQSRNETAPMHIKSSTLMEAQKKLNQEGFDAGRADGKWGTKTTEAVKSFQEKNNLPVTGKLDKQTLADLGIGTPSTTGGSVNETQSSEPSESSSMSSGGQQNMMEHDHMGGGTPSTTGRSVNETQSSEPSESSSMSSGGQQNVMQRHKIECAHYMAMNAAGQTTMVNSMRSKMPAANKMPSSHEMAKKVAASCKDHPGMMVHKVMENVMPQTNVMAQ
jgi:Putative peptidoglycan binding domain